MGPIDKPAQVVRRPITVIGREEIDAVVAPAEFAGEIRDRHHLYHADASPRQRAQLPGSRGPSPLARESADMHFVNDLAFHLHPRPALIAPAKIPMIDDTRGAVRTARL